MLAHRGSVRADRAHLVRAVELVSALKKDFRISELLMLLVCQPEYLELRLAQNNRRDEDVLNASHASGLFARPLEERKPMTNALRHDRAGGGVSDEVRPRKEPAKWPSKWCQGPQPHHVVRALNTYSALKAVIWNSVINAEECPSTAEQLVDMNKLMSVLEEIVSLVRSARARGRDIDFSVREDERGREIETDRVVEYILEVLPLVDIKSAIKASGKVRPRMKRFSLYQLR